MRFPSRHRAPFAVLAEPDAGAARHPSVLAERVRASRRDCVSTLGPPVPPAALHLVHAYRFTAGTNAGQAGTIALTCVGPVRAGGA